MKTKMIIIIVCCILLAAFALGATGVVKVTNEAAQEAAQEDRLVGVLITQESINSFDFERHFNENIDQIIDGRKISKAESAEYQRRLYATLVETSQISESGETVTTKEYVFDGINGIRYFASLITDVLYMNIGEEITDCSTYLNSSDDGEGMSLKGTIYIAYSSNSDHLVYINPVYQSPNGEVYAVGGECFYFDPEMRVSFSYKISETAAMTSGNKEASSDTEAEISICGMDVPTNIALLQFNSKNELLDKTDYIPGTLPEQIDALPDTQYIIVETSFSESVSRTIIQNEDDEDESVCAFYCRDDGICIKQSSEINWNK